MIDMIFFGLVYVLLVYFMVVLMKPRTIRPKSDDDNEGGVQWEDLPKIDLPPGVSLPGGGPTRHINKEEEVFT